MKILLIQETDWFEKGPLQQHHLMEKLSIRGHDVLVIDYEITWNLNETNELISKREEFKGVTRVYKGANITVIRPPIIKISSLDYASILWTRRTEIEKQVNEFKPDIIIGLQILTPYIGKRIAKKYGLPFIYYWTDSYHAQIPLKMYQPLGKMIEKRILKDSDAVIVINDVLKDLVLSLGSDPDNTYVETAGLDFEIFNSSISGRPIREKYNLSNDSKIILFVGWIYPFSGLKETILEFYKMNDKIDDIFLMIVGEGDGLEELGNIIEEYQLKDKVIITGKQPYHSVPEYIAAADVCILPSFNNEIMKDIVPIKIYEYMSMSKPVICTRLPGVMKEFGKDNGVFYVDEPKKVFHKTLELIKNDELGLASEKAYEFVKGNDWESVVDHLEKLIKELIIKED